MKITNENAADCTIRIADDMNYGWGEFKKGVADNSKHVQGRGRKKKRRSAKYITGKHRFMRDTGLEPIMNSISNGDAVQLKQPQSSAFIPDKSWSHYARLPVEGGRGPGGGISTSRNQGTGVA